MTNVGIAHNGPMTSFTLDGCKCGREWYLCREDIQRISKGSFTFDDIRPDLELLEDERPIVERQAKDILNQIANGVRWADLGEGFYNHFETNAGKYGNLKVTDLGKKFLWKGIPFVFLGAKPRARRFHLIARNLVTGRQYKFAIPAVEEALAKCANVEAA